MTEYKSEQLSSSFIKYVLDKRSGLVHDRSCVKISEIPDGAFAALPSFPDHVDRSRLPPCCLRRLLVRKGVPDYSPTVDMEKMESFFSLLGATDEQLLELFLDLNATFLYQSPLKGIFYVNKDAWQVVVDGNGSVRLFHNSYRVNKNNYSRQMAYGRDGFHEQNLGRRRNHTFKDAFRVITQYSWENHIEYLKSKDDSTR